MFSKIYLALLGISIAVMAFMSYYAWSWLHSIGQPDAAMAEFYYYSAIASTTLWVSTAVLLIFANAILWHGRAWAIWTTFLFFAAFAVIRYFGLEFAFADFRMRSFPNGTGVLTGPMIAVVLIILMAAIAFFNQFIVTRMRAKTLGTRSEAATPDEPVPE